VFLAGEPARLAPGQVEGGAADGSDQERLGIAREVALVPPEADEGVLHDILGVGEGTRPLAGAKEHFRSVGLEPDFPGSRITTFLHWWRGGRWLPEERHDRPELSKKGQGRRSMVA